MTARWPAQFRFPFGEFSMILFTPWTTLQDLRINLDNIARFPLVCGPPTLSRRLQIFPGRPIERLARKDGLVVKALRSPFYNSGCIVSSDQAEVPWRFRHREIGLLCRLGQVLSLVHDGRPAEDPDSRIMTAALAASPDTPREPMALFRRAVDAVARNPKIGSLAELAECLTAPGPAGKTSRRACHLGSRKPNRREDQ